MSNWQYQMVVKEPMFHLAERNLLLRVFQERMRNCTMTAPCEIRLIVSRHWHHQKKNRADVALGMTARRGEDAEKLPRKMMRRYRVKLYRGLVILSVQVCCEEALNESEAIFAKTLVADLAEELKLFANGDCFMKTGAEKLVARLARETGIEDPTAWTKAYLAPPPYMERPEVRRYYRLYKKLNHAQPQNLLRRTAEELVETPV